MLKRYLQKDTQQAIMEHGDFFCRPDQVKAVYSYGFSFSDADMVYLDEIEKHSNPGDVTWYLNRWDVGENPGFKTLLEERGYQVEIAEW
ncbi:AbiH family protein [Roseburia hominis]